MTSTQATLLTALKNELHRELDRHGLDYLTVIECALRDDPSVTADDIRAIWAEATEDARVEREREVKS